MKTHRTFRFTKRVPIFALCFVALALTFPTAMHGATRVVAWGDNFLGQTNVPPGLTDVTSMSGGLWHSVAIRANGTVVAWGGNDGGQTSVPQGLSGVMAVTGGGDHSMALKSNGTVVAWGGNLRPLGQATVPAGLNNVAAIAAGMVHSVALRSNGTVTVWGSNLDGQRDLPREVTNVVSIAAGAFRTVAIKADGTTIQWGDKFSGTGEIPSDLKDVVAVSAADGSTLALKADGTVVAWGNSNFVAEITVPAGLSDVVSVAAVQDASLALKSDGTLVVWGRGSSGETNLPLGLTNVFAVAGGLRHCLAILGDGKPAFVRGLPNRTVYVGTDLVLSAGAVGVQPMSYHWLFDGAVIADATNATLSLPNLHVAQAGAYGVVVSNALGSISQSAVINVGASAPIIFAREVNQTNVAGTSTEFRVTADGTRPLHYQWRLNGTILDGATNISLNLSRIAPADGGIYSVLVSNAVGTASVAIAGLSVLTNFSFTAGPRSQAVPAGFPLALVVAVEGVGPFLYQWRFNGAEMTGATNTHLFRPSMSADVAGSYDVIVSNPFLSITSAPALVTVLTGASPVTGHFVSDFNAGLPPGVSLFGKSLVAADGGVAGSGVLKLMTNAGSAFGDVVIDDFSQGAPVTALFARFDLLLGGGHEVPADGFSFNFATNFYRPLDDYGPPRREDGFTNGLSVSFDTWDSGTEGGDPDDTAPAVEVKVFGRQLSFQSLAGIRFGRPPAGPLLTDPLTGQPLAMETEPPLGKGTMTHFEPVTIELKVDDSLWVTYRGVLVLSNVQTRLPPISGGKFAFAARVGEAYENVWIDNLGIQTYSGPRPVAFAGAGPTNAAVKPGQAAAFATDVVGTAPISLQWYSNNVPILNATNSTHTTPPAAAENSGDVYRVEASNPISSASRSATLTVLIQPLIVQQPQSQTNMAGDDVTFTVTVTNNATLPITYQWRKVSTILTNIVLNSRTCSFTLFNVATNITATNGPGRYRVVVMNAANPTGLASSLTNLTVLQPDPPAATTLVASDVGPAGATLNATVNPMGAVTTGWFDYGLSAAYGSRTAATNVGNASGPISFGQRVDGLLPGTNYHYRVAATNYGGTALGSDLTFTTTSASPRPIISNFTRLGDGRFRLQFTGVVGAAYTVLVSTNLSDWTPLGPAVELTPGHFEFTDADAPNHSQRFYRLLSP